MSGKVTKFGGNWLKNKNVTGKKQIERWKTFSSAYCMIKIFRGGRGGDTFKTPSPTLRTTFAFTHPLLLDVFEKIP